ncbi:MAG: Hsp20/alpha crystallin family protein [Clostridia bacterium]|nr:Hsp20/alpha crystallin family protein [Clostridia bacterium]
MFGLTPYRKNNQTSVYTYNPFREMEELERKFFGDYAASFGTDIRDCGDSYLLEADLPGFAKEDITLDIEDDILTINAERHSEYENSDKKDNYLRCERSYGKYSRSFDVSMINKDAITAKLENGVLKLTLPKKVEQPKTTKRLEIE